MLFRLPTNFLEFKRMRQKVENSYLRNEWFFYEIANAVTITMNTTHSSMKISAFLSAHKSDTKEKKKSR